MNAALDRRPNTTGSTVPRSNETDEAEMSIPSPFTLATKVTPEMRRSSVPLARDANDSDASLTTPTKPLRSVSFDSVDEEEEQDVAQFVSQTALEHLAWQQQHRRDRPASGDEDDDASSDIDTQPNDVRSDATTSFVAYTRRYLQTELSRSVTSADVADSAGIDAKRERVHNFLNVPLEFEKLMLFGFCVCVDAFLHIFTILPLRFVIAVATFLRSPIRCVFVLFLILT
jgi:hypothetical protein